MTGPIGYFGAMPLRSLRKAIKHTYLYLRRSALSALPKETFDGKLSSKIDSLLIISQRRLGDIVLEIPALIGLRQDYGQATLAVVAPSVYHPLLTWACRPDELFEYPGDRLSTRNLVATLRREQWQVVIDLTTDYHLAPARLARASGAKVRIGFECSGRGHYFNIVIPEAPEEHMADRFRRPLVRLGINTTDQAPLPSLPEAPPSIPVKKPGSRLTGIHPGATHWTQRWPADYYAELAVKIHKAGDTCVVIGGEEDRALVEQICRMAEGAVATSIIAAGVLELAAAVNSLDVLVCNNSGPLHLAGLLGVPTLSFMGPTIKERWWPRSPAARVLRRDDLSCIGCNQTYCRIRTHACMREISPSLAYEAYKTLAST